MAAAPNIVGWIVLLVAAAGFVLVRLMLPERLKRRAGGNGGGDGGSGDFGESHSGHSGGHGHGGGHADGDGGADDSGGKRRE